MVRNLRPKQAAKALGISLPTFWRYARNDPSFPQLIKQSTNVTVIREADLEAYVDKKAEQSAGAKVAAAA